ncbi:hypothetical protein, partial [Planococcus glaciei]|uniref:hypothetical protein n=1 Tax=Planococcus glaciei TaxID=459472 RepID=UPI001C73648E
IHIYAKIKVGHHQFLQCDRGCEHCSIGIDETLFLFTQLYGLNLDMEKMGIKRKKLGVFTGNLGVKRPKLGITTG